MKTAIPTTARRSTAAKTTLAGIAFAALVAAAGLGAGVGCASQHQKHLEKVRLDMFDAGDLTTAKKDLERREKKAPSGEKTVLELDAASVALCDGDVKTAKSKLIAVRDAFDDLEAQAVKKAAEDALSYWTDDNSRAYCGTDYEKITIRATLAIADLLDGGEDARAFAYQIAAKQDEIVRGGAIDDPRGAGNKVNPKTAYPRIPLGPYVEGLLWEEARDEKEAARQYEKVVAWRPQFRQGAIDLERARTSVHSKPGFGRLYVFAFVGRGPYKEQTYSEATQFALLIADQIFSATNKYAVPPTLAPVPIPQIVVQEPNFYCVAVDVDGERAATTETLTDVNEYAVREDAATRDQAIARAVVRRVVKKGTVYAAEQVGQVNNWVGLAANAVGVVWEATETADTRCWGLLPAQIQVANVELPVGERRVTLYPGNTQGEKVGASVNETVRIDANRNTYLLVNFPDREPIGETISSSR